MATGTAGLLQNISALAELDAEWDTGTTNVVVAAKARKDGKELTSNDVAGFRKTVDAFMSDGTLVKNARNAAYSAAPTFPATYKQPEAAADPAPSETKAGAGQSEAAAEPVLIKPKVEAI